VLLQSSAAIALTGPSHQATAGVTYETNTGLEVSLSSDRDIAAVPFNGDDTFAPGEGVEITAPGEASASITDGTFADGQTLTRATRRCSWHAMTSAATHSLRTAR